MLSSISGHTSAPTLSQSPDHVRPTPAPEVQKSAETLTQQAYSAVRPAMHAVATGVLDVAYVTELLIGATVANRPYFTQAEYTEQFDVGATLGAIRDALRAPSEIDESRPACDGGDASDLDALLHEASRKVDRWLERFHGPKTEYLELVVGGLAVGTAIGYVAKRF